MSDNLAPFSKAYVLKTTSRHMRRSNDISIRKTFDRMKDFTDDSSKKTEVMETLDCLHKMRKMLDDFQMYNQHLFAETQE